MAQSEHLPIYKAAYDACLYFEDVVRKFPRYQKYSIGEEVRSGLRRVLRLVVRANGCADKVPLLLDLRGELEELKVLLRLCNDTRAFPNFHSFETGIRLVTDIARQNEGWLKSQRQGRDSSRARQNRRVILDEIAEPSVR